MAICATPDSITQSQDMLDLESWIKEDAKECAREVVDLTQEKQEMHIAFGLRNMMSDLMRPDSNLPIVVNQEHCEKLWGGAVKVHLKDLDGLTEDEKAWVNSKAQSIAYRINKFNSEWTLQYNNKKYFEKRFVDKCETTGSKLEAHIRHYKKRLIPHLQVIRKEELNELDPIGKALLEFHPKRKERYLKAPWEGYTSFISFFQDVLVASRNNKHKSKEHTEALFKVMSSEDHDWLMKGLY